MTSLRREITASGNFPHYRLLFEALKLNIKNDVHHKYCVKLSFSLLVIIFHEHQQNLNIFVSLSMCNHGILSLHYDL